MEPNTISKYHLGVRWRLNVAESLLKLNRTDILLDAGCADGYITQRLARHVKKTVGVDYAKDVINFANKLNISDNVEFRNADLNFLKTKFKKATFTKIVSLEVLEHARNFDNILANFSYVLKKNGQILITVPIGEHGHFEYKNKDKNEIVSVFSKNNLKVKLIENIRPPLFTSLMLFCVKKLQRLAGHGEKDVDIFSETTSFELYSKPSISFKLYKSIFPLFLFISSLDKKIYRKGGDRLLIIAVKK